MMMHEPSDTSIGARPALAADRRDAMLNDWRAGMRQVDIAAKYCCSQGSVSRLIGGSPRAKAAPEPDHAELRARLLLAQALINHRATAEGLAPADVAAVLGALSGQWDKAVA